MKNDLLLEIKRIYEIILNEELLVEQAVPRLIGRFIDDLFSNFRNISTKIERLESRNVSNYIRNGLSTLSDVQLAKVISRISVKKLAQNMWAGDFISKPTQTQVFRNFLNSIKNNTKSYDDIILGIRRGNVITNAYTQSTNSTVIPDFIVKLNQEFNERYINAFNKYFKQNDKKLFKSLTDAGFGLKDIEPQKLQLFRKFWGNTFKRNPEILAKVDKLFLKAEQKAQLNMPIKNIGEFDEIFNTLLAFKKQGKEDISRFVEEYITGQNSPLSARDRVIFRNNKKEIIEWLNEKPSVSYWTPFLEHFKAMGKAMPFMNAVVTLMEKGYKETTLWHLLPDPKRLLNYITFKNPKTVDEMIKNIAMRGRNTSIKSMAVSWILINNIIYPFIYAMYKDLARGSKRRTLEAANLLRRKAGLKEIPLPEFATKEEFWKWFQQAMPFDYKSIITLGSSDVQGEDTIWKNVFFWTYWDEIYRASRDTYNEITTTDLSTEELEKLIDERFIPILRNTKEKVDNAIDNMTEYTQEQKQKLKECFYSYQNDQDITKYNSCISNVLKIVSNVKNTLTRDALLLKYPCINDNIKNGDTLTGPNDNDEFILTYKNKIEGMSDTDIIVIKGTEAFLKSGENLVPICK